MTIQKEFTFTAADGSQKTLKYSLLPMQQGIEVFGKLTPLFTTIFSGAPLPEIMVEAFKIPDLAKLIGQLVQNATIDRGDGNDFPLNASVYFTGNYGEMLDILIEVVKQNFGSFMQASFVTSQFQK